MFELDIIKNNLTTDLIGCSLQYFNKLDSTNAKAWELVKDGVPNGTVVITDDQTNGRGRQSNKWFSASEKSLTFSVIQYPNISTKQINRYSLIVGLAITDIILKLGIPAQLKWPNDILINGKKVGGILCESKIAGRKIQSLVIGIGLNVNEKITEFPETLRKTATSLKIESGVQFQLEILLAKILNQLAKRINQINKFDNQINDWENRCGHLNKQISFKYENKIINGVFKGLTEIGQAILIIDGKESIFDGSEIQL